MSYFEEAQARAKRVKSLWNLLFIPLTAGGIALVCWILLAAILFLISFFEPNHRSLESYADENARSFIVIPLVFAAMPLGMMIANTVIWLISPLRRIEENEARGRSNTNFVNSMRGLRNFAAFSVPFGIAISILVAALGH
jgi:hypothetical protein